MPKRQRPKIVKRRRPRPWKTLFAEINRAGPRADLIAELRANSVFSAAMEKYCLMLAQTIAEDIAKAQGGPIEYWVSWIKQNMQAGHLRFDFSPDNKGVRLIPIDESNPPAWPAKFDGPENFR